MLPVSCYSSYWPVPPPETNKQTDTSLKKTQNLPVWVLGAVEAIQHVWFYHERAHENGTPQGWLVILNLL